MDCEKNKLGFRDYVLDNWTFGRVCLVIVCACTIGFPGYYAITAKIPPADEWQKTTGIIFFKGSGRTGAFRTWLKTPEDEISWRVCGAVITAYGIQKYGNKYRVSREQCCGMSHHR
jgi:hypothetical protein